jgi:methionine synthase I (cobalamin-dependent)
MSDRLARMLATRPWLLADGATGSNLFTEGLVSGDAPELWNVAHPDRIASLHRRFIDAGADIILTNSFGGNRYRLALHKAETRIAELNEAAAQIARRVADESGRDVVVAGSMGPTGEIMAPVGTLGFEAASDAFAEQAAALARGGADVLWIETMSARDEAEAAIAGAGTTGLPVVCTLSFDTNGRTMMGMAPADLAALQRELVPGPMACGANCGVGASEVVAAILNLAATALPDTVLVAKANCGIPQYVDGALRYDGTPALMASYACLALDAGARIIGGCCGTTPEHIRAMRDALEAHVRGPRPDLATVIAALGDVSNGARAQSRGELDRLAGAAPGANKARRVSRRSR